MGDEQDLIEQYEEVERLANLYVASTQLHGTVDLEEVISVIVEICVNLVGAARVVVYVHDDVGRNYVPVAAHGGQLPDSELVAGEGEIGELLAKGVPVATSDGSPVAIIPMEISGKRVGAVVIDRLLSHKVGWTSLDEDLFAMLARQGAVALYGACLASSATRGIDAAEVRSRLEDRR